MSRRSLAPTRIAALSVLAVAAVYPIASAVSRLPEKATASPAPKTPAKPATKGKITFAREIAPIIRDNCATCHRPGEVAPFSLTTYEEVKKRAKQIAAVTKSRFMPPWKAESHGEFLDERRLTDDQLAALASWADAGAPKGDAAPASLAPKAASEWKLGQPDKVVGLSKPYELGPEGRDVYRCFVIPSGAEQNQFVSALEVHPGNRAVVHHVIAYLDTSGQARKLDEKEPGEGYTTSGGGPGIIPSGFLGGWAPGNEPRHLPAGIGNLLPKGSDIVLEVHYHRNGKPETDQTKVGIYYSKSPVKKAVRMLPIINPFFNIPAGAENHPVAATSPVFKDITVLGVTPHMHLLGRDMTVTATLPDKSTKPVVKVPDWDFNWQITYTYKEPLKLPAGSKVSLIAHYDNSPKNPRNPNKSPRDVRWGEQTTDEMCIAFLGYTVDEEDLTKGISGGGAGAGRRRGEQ